MSTTVERSTPTPLSVFRPTAPLPAPAAEALARLECAFLPLDIVRAVTRYETASARYDELIARPASTLSPAEFDALGVAQQTMAEAFGVLADAGRLDLTTPAETAARYRQASAHCRRLSMACTAKLDMGGEFSGLVDSLSDARDEMGHCRCQLEQAGRLDLLGVFVDEHGKTKEPLPPRPRGPHPYRTAAV